MMKQQPWKTASVANDRHGKTRRETGEAAGDHLETDAIARDALVIRTGFMTVESRKAKKNELADITLGINILMDIQGMPTRIVNLLYGLG